MPLEIIPQSITLYPQDVQVFTVRAIAPPVLWKATTDVVIENDASLTLTPATPGNATLLQGAIDGVAGIEFTFDSDMLVTSTGSILFALTGSGSHALRVTVSPTSIVVKDESANTLDTISHTTTSGDVFYIEVAGNMLRFSLNGIVETEYEALTSVRYPLRFRVDATSPYASATPHITAPRLVGNWALDPINFTGDNTFTLTPASGGTFDDSTDIWITTFTASDQPGVYNLNVQIASSSNQEADATVIVSPLSILSESSIELQPGEVVTLKTNYDAAQTSLVTWSIVSGSGSFSANQFTAGTAPGDTVVKAVYGNQEARITITVPAVMTITVSSEEVAAATPGEVLTLTTNMTGTINWTASTGTLSASSGATVTWTAPSQAGLDALIVATNGTYTVSAIIPVLNAFPYRPNLTLKWERKKTVLVSQSEDKRGRATRVKNYDNTPFESHEFTFLNRNLAELSAAQDFWDAHYPNKRFILTEAHRGIRLVLWPDSDIGFDASATCATTYTFRAIEG